MKEKTVYNLVRIWDIIVQRYDIKYKDDEALAEKIMDIGLVLIKQWLNT